MDPTERLLTRACALSLAAGIVHGIVTPDHFAQWWGYGLFFLVAGFAQAGYGAVPLFVRMVEGESVLARWRPGRLRAYLWAGVVGNVAIVGLYVVTRTVGIPFFGPEAGAVEAVRPLDVASKLLELALLATLGVLLPRVASPRAV